MEGVWRNRAIYKEIYAGGMHKVKIERIVISGVRVMQGLKQGRIPILRVLSGKKQRWNTYIYLTLPQALNVQNNFNTSLMLYKVQPLLSCGLAAANLQLSFHQKLFDNNHGMFLRDISDNIYILRVLRGWTVNCPSFFRMMLGNLSNSLHFSLV